MNLCQWNEIKEEFKEGIILGNGSSIAIDKNFAYHSLFEVARKQGRIPENLAQIFNHLKTEDFELVLLMLWHAYHINAALKVKDETTSRAYENLKDALIQSVRDVHPNYEKVKDRLLHIAGFLKRI